MTPEELNRTACEAVGIEPEFPDRYVMSKGPNYICAYTPSEFVNLSMRRYTVLSETDLRETVRKAEERGAELERQRHRREVGWVAFA